MTSESLLTLTHPVSSTWWQNCINMLYSPFTNPFLSLNKNSVLMWNGMEKQITLYWREMPRKTEYLRSTYVKCHWKTENSVLTWNIMEKQSTQCRCETSWKNRELSTDVKCHGKTVYTHASKIDSLQLYKLSNLVWKKNVRYRTKNATFWIWILQSSLFFLVLTVRKSLTLRLLSR